VDTRVVSDPLNKMLDIVTVGKEAVHGGLDSQWVVKLVTSCVK